MADDYRNTKYCPCLTQISDKKKAVETAVHAAHPKAKDMHTYISNRKMPFLDQFMEAYNWKCSYCGVSISVLPQKMFEVDHFIPKESSRFNKKSEAGYIENLVLSCYDCNRGKSSLELSETSHNKIYPDGNEITVTFVRDNDYYIRVSESSKEDADVQTFYKSLNLGSQAHRLDYLLMNMRGLREQLRDKPKVCGKLSEAIDLLQTKRNLIKET